MITTKQEKNKTTIIIPRRLKKNELKYVVDYLAMTQKKPKKVSKKKIQELADEINAAAWEKIKKKRGFKWL